MDTYCTSVTCLDNGQWEFRPTPGRTYRDTGREWCTAHDLPVGTLHLAWGRTDILRVVVQADDATLTVEQVQRIGNPLGLTHDDWSTAARIERQADRTWTVWDRDDRMLGILDPSPVRLAMSLTDN